MCGIAGILLAHKANPNVMLTKATQTKRANGHEFEMLAPMLGSTPYMLAAQFVAGPAQQAHYAPIDGQDHAVRGEDGARIVGVLKEIAIEGVLVPR